ncbi:hypothetical protein P389DRAFT_196043 [Cystobasidium minutum MCA 4210]|uniref:uncharacterized protein n=1 Tax=Cystobasidium minutum MCA 4210 TaxID=1397322 RepID=UPI0034CF913B|eukprot:jgi/Rhomi1/196043/gm1.4257_g
MPSKSFIVCLKDDSTEEDYKKQVDAIKAKGGTVDKHFGDVMKGFSATIPEDHVSTLEQDPCIQFIEPDSEVKIQS